MTSITARPSALEGLKLYHQLGVELGYINALEYIIEGELTALEASFPEDGNATLRLQGHSPLHKLLRVRRTRTFAKVKDSAIVSQIARDHGLGVSVDDSEVVRDYVIQANRTDLDFSWSVLPLSTSTCGSRTDRSSFARRGRPRPRSPR